MMNQKWYWYGGNLKSSAIHRSLPSSSILSIPAGAGGGLALFMLPCKLGVQPFQPWICPLHVDLKPPLFFRERHAVNTCQLRIGPAKPRQGPFSVAWCWRKHPCWPHSHPQKGPWG
jgi:hypothetical protein